MREMRSNLRRGPGLEPEERIPCPVCGSTTRRIFATANIAIESMVSVSGSVQSITAVSDLLLQAVIIPGDKTAEGKLIEAVAFPWFDVIAFLAKDPNAAFQIPSDKWEEMVAGAYKQAGFEEVHLDELDDVDDDALQARLDELRDVVRLTAEYVLLRGYGRLNVFPSTTSAHGTAYNGGSDADDRWITSAPKPSSGSGSPIVALCICICFSSTYTRED